MNEAAERELALKVLQFNDVLNSVAKNGYPHYLCEYLFDLTVAYMRFYEQCPVSNTKDDAVKHMRLYLCRMTASSLNWV